MILLFPIVGGHHSNLGNGHISSSQQRSQNCQDIAIPPVWWFLVTWKLHLLFHVVSSQKVIRPFGKRNHPQKKSWEKILSKSTGFTPFKKNTCIYTSPNSSHPQLLLLGKGGSIFCHGIARRLLRQKNTEWFDNEAPVSRAATANMEHHLKRLVFCLEEDNP